MQHCGENQNTNFISKNFSRKSCRLEDNVENMVEGYRYKYNTAHGLYVLDK